MPTSSKPTVILSPAPQRTSRIFTPEDLDTLHQRYHVVDLEEDTGDTALEAALPTAFAVIGQPTLDRGRLENAPNLRAICNVEGNFFPNIDYDAAHDHGIYVLGCGPAYAQAVAETSLGLAIDIARGISHEDRAFRNNTERYVSDGNQDAILLRGSRIGLVGYGNLGRAPHKLLVPFDAQISVYDPWQPDSALRQAGLEPAPLDMVLSTSQFVFVLATITAESEHLLGARELALMPDKARLILVSRAAVADFQALHERIASGQLYAAVDVWPEEPMPQDSPYRQLEGLVFSGHRAGGIPQAFHDIGAMVLDDLGQIERGLPPARMQVAARELVTRYRNRPVS